MKPTFIVTILFSALGAVNCFSQILIHHHKGTEDGLVYSQVLNIHEDSKGFLWLGTTSGLSRWNGLEFENFGQAQGLESTDIQTLCETPSGTMMVGTRKGVFVFKDGQFKELEGLPDGLKNHVESIKADKDGTLYIAAESGIWIGKGNEFNQFLDPGRAAFTGTRAIALSKRGGCFFGTSRGIQFFDGRSLVPLPELKDTNLDNIRCICEDSEGRLYIGTETGLFLYTNNQLETFDESNGLPGVWVNQVTETFSGLVYVSTSHGVAVFKDGKWDHTLTMKNGLSNAFIWCTEETADGWVYFGTDGGGFDYFRPGVWTTYNAETGLPDNTVWSILEAKDAAMYFSTEKGVAKVQGDKWTYWTSKTGLSHDQVLCSHEDRDGTLYFGNNYHGLDILVLDKFKHLNVESGLASNCVWTINEDLNGQIYLGLYGGGIDILDYMSVISHLGEEQGLPSAYVCSSFRAPDGRLYFGTDGGGGFCLDNGSVTETFLPGHTIWSISMDKEGHLLLGTNEKGLYQRVSGDWKTISVQNGLSNNCVLGILADENRHYYLATDNGLNVVSLQENKRIKVMGQKDGLAGNEFNQGAFLKDRANRLWFGTTKGVSCYQPWKDMTSSKAPRTYIKAVKLFGRTLPLSRLDKKKPFSFHENLFEFEFFGLDLVSPDKVRYRHRLSHIDSDWVESSDRRIQYTNLSPGTYSFEVMAGNDRNQWSIPEKLSFKIAKPFWKTAWFISLLVLLIGGFLYTIISNRIKRILAIERVRTKIAADLHDDIGAGLSEISILSAIIEAKSDNQQKEKIQNDVQKVGTVARNLIERMSEIVWVVNPQSDSLVNLFSRLKDSLADVLEAEHIEIKTRGLNQLEHVNLNMEARQHVYLMFKEVIHNAIKHSGCSEIQIEVNRTGKWISFAISDNGMGFDSKHKSHGNGLNNIRHRAQMVKGQIDIISAPGKGTKVVLKCRTA